MTCEVDISKYKSMIEQLIVDGLDSVANVLITLRNEAIKIDRSKQALMSEVVLEMGMPMVISQKLCILDLES